MVISTLLSARTATGLFVGNQLGFSDTVMKLVGAEFPTLGFARVTSLNDLLFMSDERTDEVRIIVVDEAMHKTLRNLMPQFLEKFQYANIVLAYRKPDIARRLLEIGQTDNSAGRIGFLPMNVQVDSWLSALRLLLSGECFVPNELLSHDHHIARDTQLFPPQTAPTPMGAEDQTPHPDAGLLKYKDDVCLTERELQVLRSVAEGKQNKIIADELKLSQHTVKLHLHHVISKLGVHNRTEAAIWFLGCRGETQGR